MKQKSERWIPGRDIAFQKSFPRFQQRLLSLRRLMETRCRRWLSGGCALAAEESKLAAKISNGREIQ